MKKLMTIAAAALGFGLLAAPASAGTISFADFASGNEQGIASNTVLNFGGQDIRFRSGHSLSASGLSFTQDFNPYFDDAFDNPPRPAGLGVCRALESGPGSECDEPGDDSIDGDFGLNEVIVLNFENGAYDLVGLSFRDGQHFSINDSLGLVRVFLVSSGGITNETTTFADLVMRAIAGEFVGATTLALAYAGTEFYLESISDVPIPGAIPLLLSGLAGLGFASRKKKAA